MELRINDLKLKEVINVKNGDRYGYVYDVVIETESGKIKNMVVHGRHSGIKLWGRREEQIISWQSVCKIGEDTVLVEG